MIMNKPVFLGLSILYISKKVWVCLRLCKARMRKKQKQKKKKNYPITIKMASEDFWVEMLKQSLIIQIEKSVDLYLQDIVSLAVKTVKV